MVEAVVAVVLLRINGVVEMNSIVVLHFVVVAVGINEAFWKMREQSG